MSLMTLSRKSMVNAAHQSATSKQMHGQCSCTIRLDRVSLHVRGAHRIPHNGFAITRLYLK